MRGLEKTYRMGDLDVRALRGVDLTVERGEFLAIMGASGSGKSTLMNVLGCLDRADGRHATLLEGVDVTRWTSPRSRRSAAAGSASCSRASTCSRARARARTSRCRCSTRATRRTAPSARDAALRAVGLAGREANHPSQLSGGEQQRVAIARALINHPAILLADEPTGNLDSKNKREIMETLRALNREQGITIVMVTHEPEMAEYADRVISMRDGQIVEDSRASGAHAAGRCEPRRRARRLAEPRDDWQRALSLLRMALAVARARDRAQQAALGAHDARHVHRRGRADRDGRGGPGRGPRGARADREPRHQSADRDAGRVGRRRRARRDSAARRRSRWRTRTRSAKEPAVADVAYSIQQPAQAQYGEPELEHERHGHLAELLAIRKWPIVAGRALRDDDMERAARVCLIGQTVYRNLFGASENPVGAEILMKGVTLEVVGLLRRAASRAEAATRTTRADPVQHGREQGARVAAPAQAQAPANPLYAPPPNPFGVRPKITGYVNQIFVQARSTEAVPEALAQIRPRLTQRHRIGAGQLPDFDVRNLSDVAQAREGSSRILRVPARRGRLDLAARRAGSES